MHSPDSTGSAQQPNSDGSSPDGWAVGWTLQSCATQDLQQRLLLEAALAATGAESACLWRASERPSKSATADERAGSQIDWTPLDGMGNCEALPARLEVLDCLRANERSPRKTTSKNATGATSPWQLTRWQWNKTPMALVLVGSNIQSNSQRVAALIQLFGGHISESPGSQGKLERNTKQANTSPLDSIPGALPQRQTPIAPQPSVSTIFDSDKQTRQLCHDLRNLLSLVQNNEQALTHFGERFEAAERNEIQAAIGRDFRRVGALLASALEEELSTQPRNYDSGLVVRDVVKASHLPFSQAKLKLNLTEVESLSFADASCPEINWRRILQNLLQNSLEAQVASGCGSQTCVHWASSEYGGYLCVSDNGPGVQVDPLHRIFEAGVTQGKPSGQGIGLNYVREAVLKAGGDIRVSNGPNGGACFELWLPVSPDQ